MSLVRLRSVTRQSGLNLKASAPSSKSFRRGLYQAPVRDIKFLINEVHDLDSHYKKLPGGEACTTDLVDTIIDESAKLSEEVLHPLNEIGDTEGCTWIDQHTVKTPTGYKAAYDTFCEGGWQGLTYPEKYGGQGLPLSLSIFQSEMAATANWTWTMYPGLSKGCINTVLLHGTEEMKDKHLPKLIAGEWTGSMCLTEPQCGSDLAQVKTKAEPQSDGSYKLTGTKIFISCGEHDMVDNILHCVLARLPGAPEGTRGISLFLVSKKIINDDGSLGDYNGVNIGRIEDKMGCHGSSTCEINFDNAVGHLIGQPNRGLNHMFTFINTSRLGTAVQGVSTAELSFQNALAYAKERLAMRSLTGTKFPEKPADPLMVHPDIRRMLLTQKAIAEGGRSMVFRCALAADHLQVAELAGDKKATAAADDKMGFLTPILKGFLTEVGLEAANLGIQIWGGHGYIKSNGMEQILRDARISSVWEGTTGIQALDLLGRKIMMQKMKPLHDYAKELYGFSWKVLTGPYKAELGGKAATLAKRALQWQWLCLKIGLKASRNRDFVGSSSVDFLMFSGYTTMGYHWLLAAEAAHKGLARKDLDADQRAFYEAKLVTADFYFERMFPRCDTHAQTMMSSVETLMKMKDEHFSFHH
jgi:alkylation response protein AidB-like acyl-CoA dehydrogenase